MGDYPAALFTGQALVIVLFVPGKPLPDLEKPKKSGSNQELSLP